MFVLLILCLLVGGLILIPLLIVGLLIKLVFGLVLLPLRLAGLAIRLGLALGFGLVGLILAATAVLLIPLLPIIFLVGAIWLILNLGRRLGAARVAG